MQRKIFFDLLFFKANADLRIEVSRYYLNYLWWILEPVFMMGTFYVVFQWWLAQGTPNFAGFLLIGLTFWNWFSHSISNASTSILHGQGLMLQVDIPKVFFPLTILLQDFFKQLFVVGLLLIFLVFYQTPCSITWLALPVVMAIQALLVVAIAVFSAMIVPFVPDLKLVIGTILNLLMFASGVFFNIDQVVSEYSRHLLYLNPICGLIKNYRLILMYASWPEWDYLLWVFLASSALLLVALWFLNRFDRIYPRICQQ
jgi:lipopolysaccharide transport system permease protein